MTGCNVAPNPRGDYNAAVESFAKHNYGEAETALRNSIHSCQRDGDNRLLADSLLLLSKVYSEQGRFASAERALKQVVAIETRLAGADSRPVASALLQLSVCHHLQAEYDDAAKVGERALAMAKKVMPANDYLIAATANNLAQTYGKLEQAPRAKELFEEALAIYRAHAKEAKGAQGVVETLNNLALFYRHENDVDAALKTVEAGLELSQGDGRLSIRNRAAGLNTLAGIERSQFDFDRAAVDYQAAIELMKKAHNRDGDEQLCQLTDNYADMLLDLKDFDQAEKVYRDAIKHCIDVHGLMHPMVAERMNDLANLYRQQDRYAEAEPLFRQVLAIDRIAFEADSPITFSTMNSLSAVYVAQKKYAEAQHVYQDWMPALTSVLGSDHPHVADAFDNWALVAEKANDTKQATELRAKARKIRVRFERPGAHPHSDSGPGARPLRKAAASS